MDYKNDNRTPRDRITGEFLSELLFTELGGECDCSKRRGTVRSDNTRRNTDTIMSSAGVSGESREYTGRARNCKNSSSRGGNVEFVGNYSLAMAYVPMQEFGDLFDIEEGFCEGTIFKALRFPFYPTPCRKESN